MVTYNDMTGAGSRRTLRILGRTLTLALCAFALGVTGCDKTIDSPELETLVPSGNDPTGGTWKTVLVPADSMVQLAAPLDSTSADYAAELQEVKTMQAQMTSQQSADVKYWSAGAVVRWNEIARSLVIKYNVQPKLGATPDPLKPFANPPFASRAYAMVAVAQYDALVTAWNAKYKYGRRAPFQVDAGIRTIVPVSDLPSYPSEHAVVAAASAEVLKFLFPGDTAWLSERLRNHEESRIVAGANVRSEIAAAEEIGRAVAQRVIARAKSDGAKDAKGADTVWTDQTSWISLETPPRPPMLPLWGKVKPWVVPSAEALRPDPPPAVGTPAYEADLAEVRHYSESRTREEWRIADVWADGGGTATPPGHWNLIASDLIRKHSLNELRAARAMSLMNMAVADAAICCWDAKYAYAFPRPSQIDPSIKTATGIPNFPSYTSGHATFSGAASDVLAYLFPSDAATMKAWGEEASISRLYASIHYHFDCDVGLQCGRNVAQYAIQLGQADGSPAN